MSCFMLVHPTRYYKPRRDLASPKTKRSGVFRPPNDKHLEKTRQETFERSAEPNHQHANIPQYHNLPRLTIRHPHDPRVRSALDLDLDLDGPVLPDANARRLRPIARLRLYPHIPLLTVLAVLQRLGSTPAERALLLQALRARRTRRELGLWRGRWVQGQDDVRCLRGWRELVGREGGGEEGLLFRE